MRRNVDTMENVTPKNSTKLPAQSNKLSFSFYLTTWFPTSCGPPETSPQSTPGRAADGVRSGPPLIPGEGSRCYARCWSHGPTAGAANIRLKCRTGQPLRCAATSPEARLSAEFTEQRRTATTRSEETHTPTKSSGKFHVSSKKKEKKNGKRGRERRDKKKKKKARLLPERLFSSVYLPLGSWQGSPNVSRSVVLEKLTGFNFWEQHLSSHLKPMIAIKIK